MEMLGPNYEDNYSGVVKKYELVALTACISRWAHT